jgi:hypothetical protein
MKGQLDWTWDMRKKNCIYYGLVLTNQVSNGHCHQVVTIPGQKMTVLCLNIQYKYYCLNELQ